LSSWNHTGFNGDGSPFPSNAQTLGTSVSEREQPSRRVQATPGPSGSLVKIAALLCLTHRTFRRLDFCHLDQARGTLSLSKGTECAWRDPDMGCRHQAASGNSTRVSGPLNLVPPSVGPRQLGENALNRHGRGTRPSRSLHSASVAAAPSDYGRDD